MAITAYVEGTAGQYLWMVPFNLKTLADMMGGPDVAAKRLDAFFTKLNVGDSGPNAWMAWVGNEPCLETPWIYCFLGQPYKTQKHRPPGHDRTLFGHGRGLSGQ